MLESAASALERRSPDFGCILIDPTGVGIDLGRGCWATDRSLANWSKTMARLESFPGRARECGSRFPSSHSSPRTGSGAQALTILVGREDRGRFRGNLGNVDRIVLIGFSGTGKTSVACRLAERLGWSAADSDGDRAALGCNDPSHLPGSRRMHFRSSERAILKNLLSRDLVVIATGGGAAVEPGTRRCSAVRERCRHARRESGDDARPAAATSGRRGGGGRATTAWQAPIRWSGFGISSRRGKRTTTRHT